MISPKKDGQKAFFSGHLNFPLLYSVSSEWVHSGTLLYDLVLLGNYKSSYAIFSSSYPQVMA
jgi:hypothetical protein